MVSCLWLVVTVERSSLFLNQSTRFSTTARYADSICALAKKGTQMAGVYLNLRHFRF